MTQNNYHELHAVEATNGDLIVHIRNHNPKHTPVRRYKASRAMAAKRGAKPHNIGVWGLPSHLLRLKDGRLLMSYGHRSKPYGNQARVSADHGKTWSNPIIVSGDGAGTRSRLSVHSAD